MQCFLFRVKTKLTKGRACPLSVVQVESTTPKIVNTFCLFIYIFYIKQMTFRKTCYENND